MTGWQWMLWRGPTPKLVWHHIRCTTRFSPRFSAIQHLHQRSYFFHRGLSSMQLCWWWYLICIWFQTRKSDIKARKQHAKDSRLIWIKYDGCKSIQISVYVYGLVIATIQQVKLLGVTNDSKLKFDDHVKSLFLKANRNVNALSMAAKVIDPPKCKLLYHSFFMSNFRYCPLIWMFCGRTAN